MMDILNFKTLHSDMHFFYIRVYTVCVSQTCRTEDSLCVVMYSIQGMSYIYR